MEDVQVGFWVEPCYAGVMHSLDDRGAVSSGLVEERDLLLMFGRQPKRSATDLSAPNPLGRSGGSSCKEDRPTSQRLTKGVW